MIFRLRAVFFLFFMIFSGYGSLYPASLEEAEALFRQRRLDDAIGVLNDLKASLPPEERKEALLLLARCFWTKAAHYTRDSDTKFDLFGRGLLAVEEALEEFGEDASFYYWKAILVGERANVKFSFESFAAADIIDDLCHRVIDIDPSYENGGAYLALGRMYYKLPKIFGGGAQKSVQYLLSAKSFNEMLPPGERTHVVYLFLAESYIALRKYDEAKVELLKGLRCPKNPDAPEEDERDYRRMERLLRELNDRVE